MDEFDYNELYLDKPRKPVPIDKPIPKTKVIDPTRAKDGSPIREANRGTETEQAKDDVSIRDVNQGKQAAQTHKDGVSPWRSNRGAPKDGIPIREANQGDGVQCSMAAPSGGPPEEEPTECAYC